MSPVARCRACRAELDPVLPTCPECGAPVPRDAPSATDKALKGRRPWRAPWGLFAVLAAYFLGTWLYMNAQYYASPRYQAARHLRIAAQLLGNTGARRDDGRTVETSALRPALDHVLAAVKLFPEDTFGHARVELVIRRLEERGEKAPREARDAWEALGATARRMEDAREPMLAIGARDLWDVDEVLALPGQAVQWSLAGAAVIVLLWGFKWLQDRRAEDQMRLEREAERRRDLEELDRPKRRV